MCWRAWLTQVKTTLLTLLLHAEGWTMVWVCAVTTGLGHPSRASVAWAAAQPQLTKCELESPFSGLSHWDLGITQSTSVNIRSFSFHSFFWKLSYLTTDKTPTIWLYLLELSGWEKLMNEEDSQFGNPFLIGSKNQFYINPEVKKKNISWSAIPSSLALTFQPNPFSTLLPVFGMPTIQRHRRLKPFIAVPCSRTETTWELGASETKDLNRSFSDSPPSYLTHNQYFKHYVLISFLNTCVL